MADDAVADKSESTQWINHDAEKLTSLFGDSRGSKKRRRYWTQGMRGDLGPPGDVRGLAILPDDRDEVARELFRPSDKPAKGKASDEGKATVLNLLDRYPVEVIERIAEVLEEVEEARDRSAEVVKLAPDIDEVIAIGDEQGFWATGISIGDGYVLTAGHVEALGGNKLICTDAVLDPSQVAKKSSMARLRENELEVVGCVRHPHYWDDPFFIHDLAVLKVGAGASLPDPPQIATVKEFHRARAGVLVGFGHKDGYGKRRRVEIPILHEGRVASTRWFHKNWGYDRRFEFIAVDPLYDRDACTGDSGAALFIMDGKERKLAGLVSRQFGLGGRLCGAGSIYVKLFKDEHDDGRRDYWATIEAMKCYVGAVAAGKSERDCEELMKDVERSYATHISRVEPDEELIEDDTHDPHVALDDL